MPLAFCSSAILLSSRTSWCLSVRTHGIYRGLTPLRSSASSSRERIGNQGSRYVRALALLSDSGQREERVSPGAQIDSKSTGSDSVDLLRLRFRDLSKSASSSPRLREQLILDEFPFPLDGFQLDALSALSNGENVVLAAPTGSGKTIVGELAVYLALCRNLRVFYTTPLKALSNQKFYDFKKQFGEERVGLLTGDVTVNRDADVVVMTTEVYRNMLYADSTENRGDMAVTDKLFAVVFDEFHYLNDRERGTVWEESVINSPEHVLLVALSATMSNTADVRNWFGSVQGPTRLIESSERPVPLRFAYGDQEGITPLFADAKKSKEHGGRKKGGFGKRSRRSAKRSSNVEVKLHPKLLRRLKDAEDSHERNRRSRPASHADDRDDSSKRMQDRYREISSRANRRSRSKYREIPSFPFVVRSLRRRDMLPCIVFIFSRAGCDRAAISASSERDALVSDAERERIRERLDAFAAEHPGLVQADRLNLALQGIASHHAGLLPLWKLCVEELFQDGLIKVVFATETLAAGINMPARTTVISALSKRAGELGIVPLTTSEVLQMAGRAGRRGKDVLGHSVVLRSRSEGALEAFKVLTADVDALESKFSPNYGMVLNLLSARSLKDSKTLVDRSFGNFLRQEAFSDDSEESTDADVSVRDLETIIREKAALEAILSEARSVLSPIDEGVLRSYMKNIERVKAEKRALAYLVQQSTETDSELIEDTLTFAPVGTRLLLRERKNTVSTGTEKRSKRRQYSAALVAAAEGDLGQELRSFYLGTTDPALEEMGSEEAEDRGEVVEAVLLDMHSESAGVLPTFAAVDASGVLRLFNHTAVARLLYDEDPLDVTSAVENWAELSLPGRSEWKSIGGGEYATDLPTELSRVAELVKAWRSERGNNPQAKGSDSFDVAQQHPEVYAQQQRVRHALEMVRKHMLHSEENIATIVAAKRAIPKIEGTLNGTMDPLGGKKSKGKPFRRYSGVETSSVAKKEYRGQAGRMSENASWDEFMSLVSVLQHYGFVDEEHNVTSLGSIGAKVRSENEVWTSLVLLQPSLETVSPVHLGAILGATQMEGGRSDVYVEKEISSETREQLQGLEAERLRLQAVQSEFGVWMGVSLDSELMGLVETWAGGASWVELLSGTSLQEGDACRILRRVLDLLRQVQYLPVVGEGLKRNAKRAVALLDRFPVSDERTYVVRESERLDGEDAPLEE